MNQKIKPGINDLPGLSEAQHRELSDSLLPVFRKLLEKEFIDQDLDHIFESIYLPLADWIANKHQSQLLVLGINGAQGSGKSTLALILKRLLTDGFGKHVQILSIDDIYLLKEERQHLAETVHPLFGTRGVPGTHDVQLGLDTIRQLREQADAPVSLPRFDKGSDQRKPESDWPRVESPVDVLIFEGWCVGALPQSEGELDEPVNVLEREEDKDGSWRTLVNQHLADSYQKLFSEIDVLLMMTVPGVEKILEWRGLQEEKLTQRGAISTMDEAELQRFIMLDDRITRASWREMPARADIVLMLGEAHQIESVIINSD